MINVHEMRFIIKFANFHFLIINLKNSKLIIAALSHDIIYYKKLKKSEKRHIETVRILLR